MTNPHARAAESVFRRLARPETYTAPGGPPVTVQAVWERGIRDQRPGRESVVIDADLRAHLLVSEVGRPNPGARLTDSETGEEHQLGTVEDDNGYAVIVRAR